MTKPVETPKLDVLEPREFTDFLGQASWLMINSKDHKHLPITEIEARILPALLLKQFRIYANGQKPVAFVTWAAVSDKVKSDFQSGVTRLSATDWRSGENVIVVDCISPFGPPEKIVAEFLKSLKTKSDIQQD